MKDAIEWTGFISSAFGVVSLSIGGLLWWEGRVRKSYAAERDFAHLRRQYEQLSQNLATLSDDLSEQMQDIRTEVIRTQGMIQRKHDN
jgi:hypothetical protein